MCGRFALTFDGDELAQHMSHQLNRTVKPPEANYDKSYNVAPTNEVPVYFVPGAHSQREENAKETGQSTKDNECTLTNMRWGFIPHWAKDKEQFKGYATINARLENLKANKLYGQSLKAKRCVVPVSGYYEWTKPNPKVNKAKLKIPYYVTRKDSDEVMYLAGIYDYNDREKIHSFSVITGHAPEGLEWLHLRMPCVLEPGSKAWNLWLEDQDKQEWTQKELSELLRPWYDEDHYTCYEVSKVVGKVTNKDPYLVEPVSKPKPSIKKEEEKFKKESKVEEGEEVPKLTKGEKEDYNRLKHEGDVKAESVKEESGNLKEELSSLGEESATPAKSSSASSEENKIGGNTSHKRRPNVLEMLHMGKKKKSKT